jgi:hypothetical protein
MNDDSKPKHGEYRLLEDGDTLPTGVGIWLAGRAGLDTLALGDGVTASPGATGVYRLSLVKGWNQVTCPSMEPIPWPVGFKDTVAHDKSKVKWLQSIDTLNGGYVETDTLMPWRGYFVHSDLDTMLDLFRADPDIGAAPKAAAVGEIASTHASSADQVPVQIILEPSRAERNGVGSVSPVRLGAARFAVDGAGVEDEPMPPAAGDRSTLASVRAGRGWKTDLLRFRSGSGFAWKLAWSSREGKASSVATLRVGSLRLPEGMRLWAASPSRKIAEPVEEGAELEVQGDASDTLVFWAAPPGKAFPGLDEGYALKPSIRSVTLARGTALRLALPAATGLRVECRDASGRRVASLRRAALAPGYYDFPLATHGSGGAVAGFMTVTVEFFGGAEPGRIVLKSIRP